jgi:hypothetical protein
MSAIATLQDAGWRILIEPVEKKPNAFLFEAYPPQSDPRAKSGGCYSMAVEIPGSVSHEVKTIHVEQLASSVCKEEGLYHLPPHYDPELEEVITNA